MEEKKKGNALTIILFVLLLIAVGVICYLLGSNSVKDNDNNNNEIKEESKEQVEENNKDNTNVNIEEKDEEIVITPVAYTPKCIDSSVSQNTLMTDIDETKYNNISEYIKSQEDVNITIKYCKDGTPNGIYNLTDLEKNSVLNEIKSSAVSIEKSGIGGACVHSLEINYKRNNKEYNVFYFGLFAMTSNDGNIYKILDKSVNNTLEQPQYCLYNFNNLSTTANSILNRLISN